jgi:hypothetical protein
MRTVRNSIVAAGVESATRWGVDSAGNFTFWNGMRPLELGYHGVKLNFVMLKLISSNLKSCGMTAT